LQLATYARLLDGRPDVLACYRLEPLEISDTKVVRLSGKPVHAIACFTGDSADRISGTLFEIGDPELASSDAYEVDAYARVEVLLESGTRAFPM
jgi:hypothetical protein